MEKHSFFNRLLLSLGSFCFVFVVVVVVVVVFLTETCDHIAFELMNSN